jgi:hypothetical protein
MTGSCTVFDIPTLKTVENKDPKHDRLCKPTCIFDVLKNASSKYYSLSETLPIEGVIHTVF